jgi:hypothetical protein
MPQITIVLGAPMGGDEMHEGPPEAPEKEDGAEQGESEAGEYGFADKTRLPFAALSPKERIRREFGEGMALSEEQKAALECFEALPSTTQNMLLRKASEAGQSFILGSDLASAKEMVEGDSEKREDQFASLEDDELDDTTESEFD